MKGAMFCLAVAGLIVMPTAGAGPYDQVYGQIQAGDKSAAREQEPVAITKIDGQQTRNARRPDPVAPGKHAVEVTFSSARVIVNDQVRTFAIEVEPCKRYRIAAKYEVALSGQWEPVVQSVEDIGECKRKFMKGEPAKK